MQGQFRAGYFEAHPEVRFSADVLSARVADGVRRLAPAGSSSPSLVPIIASVSESISEVSCGAATQITVEPGWVTGPCVYCRPGQTALPVDPCGIACRCSRMLAMFIFFPLCSDFGSSRETRPTSWGTKIA